MLLKGFILTLAAISLSVICTPAATLQEKRWDAARVTPAKAVAAGRIVDRIMSNKKIYQEVDQAAGVPWYVIAAIHNMESGGSFKRHLHEGSLLTARTRYVPKGRPKTGKPPFTWTFSATDALVYDSMGKVLWWRLDDTLYATERYNGTGYLRYHPPTPTPYLWAGTTVERPGKYVADGKWSSTARSSQIGCATVWKVMEQRGILNFSRLGRSK